MFWALPLISVLIFTSELENTMELGFPMLTIQKETELETQLFKVLKLS